MEDSLKKYCKHTVQNGSHILVFDSLSKFKEYAMESPNALGENSSVTGSYNFTETHSFDEALNLFNNGWSSMAEKLTKKLATKEKELTPAVKAKRTYAMAGFQASVPRYLQGMPNNMINVKQVPVKQKIVTVTKLVNYSASVSKETIMEESIKALMVVKKLEAQGMRINLDVMLGTEVSDMKFFIKIRIKHSTERLNVAKMAFPLVHPSMLRRLLFRAIEVYPQISKKYCWGYGRPSEVATCKALFKDEVMLPPIFYKKLEDIKGLEDL